ncbi:AI-2E family transporter [Winogradskyella maritima]|uniref:AI-2E family transporter n=1 Tax=Winogradskyella maritima TaxID=1517766 RepID=A0ABV8AGP8_9FLAO|nr:AI-2E family transporter [Winogradskyella maritima]
MIAKSTIRQTFIIILILVIVVLIFRELMPYFSGILGAITLYVLMKKYMQSLINRGWRPALAALTLMFISFIVITLPLVAIALMLGNKVGDAISNSEKIISAVKANLNHLEAYINFDLTSQINLEKVSSWISSNSQAVLGNAFNGFIAVSIMYFILYYMLVNQKRLRESLFSYIPIADDNLKIMGSEIYDIVKSNAFGIPLVAIAQGIVALIGFLIFGVDDPAFWAVVVAIGSMIPFVGNLLGTIPVFILSYSNGDSFQAWGVLIYGMTVVAATDNVIRLFVLKKLDNVHPLITLFGVLVGIPLFGFLGLIFGPLLVSLLLLFVRIYKKEYAS